MNNGHAGPNRPPPAAGGYTQARYARIRAPEGELETLRNVRTAAADRAKATQVAVANALNAAADRIEKTTQVINRTIGNGVAIG